MKNIYTRKTNHKYLQQITGLMFLTKIPYKSNIVTKMGKKYKGNSEN